MKPAPNANQRTWLRILILLLLLSGLPAAAILAGRFLVNADEVLPADAVIALGGDDGMDRLEKAVQYYKDGSAQVLIISDVQVNTASGLDYADYLRNAAIALGVKENDIYITEVHANTTHNEARATRKLMLRNGWNSVIVVTDPFHTRRARAYFRDDFAEHGLTAYITYTAEHWYRPTRWFFSAEVFGHADRIPQIDRHVGDDGIKEEKLCPRFRTKTI